MLKAMRSIYDFPQIFRAVHMEEPREIIEETEFLKKLWARHLKRPVRRVLDVACGDSPDCCWRGTSSRLSASIALPA